jgi:class 3 adenylate cyclase
LLLGAPELWVLNGTRMAAAARDSRGSPILAWGTCVVTLGLVAATVVLVLLNLQTIHDPDQANLIEIVLPIGFAVLGGLVGSRQPSNRLGWVFLLLGVLTAVGGVTRQYTRFALVTEPGAPFTAWIPWISDFVSPLVYPAGLATLAFLLTPNGHFLSPRWRWVAWSGAVVTTVLVILTVTAPGIGEFSVSNPTAVPAIIALAPGRFETVAYIGGLSVLVVAGSSGVIRLRRARGEERLQLRWIAAAGSFAVVINVVTAIPYLLVSESVGTVFGTLAAVIGFGIALPAGFAVAMLRYRLYDLDLLLNRTALYGAVTAVLVGALFVANVAAQRALESLFSQRSDLVTAGLGVAAGLAFGPMRRAIRPIVDRALPARARLTLLFTDIVESTQAIVDLGDERWREVLDRYRAVVRQELSHHRGREVNTAGDAFFAVFDRPMSAVRCATAMRDDVKALGLRVRTGIHCGEVEMRGEQVTGLAVHAAARVMGLAGEDQVLISDDVAQLLDDAFPLRDAGRHELRGVPGMWQLYEVPSEWH